MPCDKTAYLPLTPSQRKPDRNPRCQEKKTLLCRKLLIICALNKNIWWEPLRKLLDEGRQKTLNKKDGKAEGRKERRKEGGRGGEGNFSKFCRRNDVRNEWKPTWIQNIWPRNTASSIFPPWKCFTIRSGGAVGGEGRVASRARLWMSVLNEKKFRQVFRPQKPSCF